VFFLSIPIFSQAQESVYDCENFGIGARFYNTQYFDIIMQNIEKDICIVSMFGYFEKSLQMLEKTLREHKVSKRKINLIIQEIKTLAEDEEKAFDFGSKETKNVNGISIFYTERKVIFPLSINYTIERYLDERKAKEVLTDLLEKSINTAYPMDFLQKQFCVFQKMGVIDKKYRDYYAFLKDYLGK
jgi:hypothetical protein